MQTFLPFADYRKSLEYLDNIRLNRQIMECFKLCKNGWPNHPANIMWRGYHKALVAYGYEACDACAARGGNPGRLYAEYFVSEINADYDMPWWFGDERFHKSHLDNLHWKWNPVGPQPPYVWPVHDWEWSGNTVALVDRRKGFFTLRERYSPGKTTTKKDCVFLLQGL